MFRKRVASAIFIDFDNVFLARRDDPGFDGFGQAFVDAIPNWLAWFEDGRFEKTAAPRRRRFVEKRVYLGFNLRQHQTLFQDHGFDAYIGRSFTRRQKSTADLLIALDAMESLYRQPGVEEYVIVSSDTDFVPLIDRLRDSDKQTVAVFKDRASFSAYEDRATFAIDAPHLRDAFVYQRPRPFWARLTRRAAEEAPAPKTPAGAPPAEEGAAAAAPEHKPSRIAQGPLGQGVNRLRREGAALSRGGRPVKLGRDKVIKTLRPVGGFRVMGRETFFGLGSYENLILHIADAQADFVVIEEENGGIVLQYRPEATAAAAP